MSTFLGCDSFRPRQARGDAPQLSHSAAEIVLNALASKERATGPRRSEWWSPTARSRTPQDIREGFMQ